MTHVRSADGKMYIIKRMDYSKIQCSDLSPGGYDEYLIDKFYGEGISKFVRENDEKLDVLDKKN